MNLRENRKFFLKSSRITFQWLFFSWKVALNYDGTTLPFAECVLCVRYSWHHVLSTNQVSLTLASKRDLQPSRGLLGRQPRHWLHVAAFPPRGLLTCSSLCSGYYLTWTYWNLSSVKIAVLAKPFPAPQILSQHPPLLCSTYHNATYLMSHLIIEILHRISHGQRTYLSYSLLYFQCVARRPVTPRVSIY